MLLMLKAAAADAGEDRRPHLAVSDLARRWQMEALGSDAVEIPNGVDVAAMASAPVYDGSVRPAKTVLFLGRYDENPAKAWRC